MPSRRGVASLLLFAAAAAATAAAGDVFAGTGDEKSINGAAALAAFVAFFAAFLAAAAAMPLRIGVLSRRCAGCPPRLSGVFGGIVAWKSCGDTLLPKVMPFFFCCSWNGLANALPTDVPDFFGVCNRYFWGGGWGAKRKKRKKKEESSECHCVEGAVRRVGG